MTLKIHAYKMAFKSHSITVCNVVNSNKLNISTKYPTNGPEPDLLSQG